MSESTVGLWTEGGTLFHPGGVRGEGGEDGKGWEVVIHAMPDSRFLVKVENKWMLRKHCALRFIITHIKHYCYYKFTCVCHSFLESGNSVLGQYP